MLGTPSLTAKAIVIGERVQNFRCRQPEGSGSSGKLRPKSITVTTGPSSGFNTSPRPPQKCQPVRPTAATSDAPDHEEPRSPKRKLSAVACQRPLPSRRRHSVYFPYTTAKADSGG